MSEENILTSAISKKISRRSFLKWSAALGATASASGLVAQTGLKVAGATAGSYEPYATQGGTWVGTTCLVCHSWCQKAVLVNAGVVRKIEGIGGQPRAACVSLDNPNDANYTSAGVGFLPYSLHNRGRICAKGNDGLEHLYDPERIKYPLKRVGARGAGKWTKITWDAAYMEISTALRELAGKTTDANGNPIPGARGLDLRHRHVTYVGRNETGGSGGLAGIGFTKNYGSPNHVEHTSLCELSRHVAHWLTFGDKFPLPDLQSHAGTISGTAGALHDGPASDYNVDFFVSCGGNWAECTIPHTSYAARVTDMRRRGTRIVGIDVRQSNSLAVADEQFFLTPGTDAALALGIIHQMLSAAGCTGSNISTVGKDLLDAGHEAGKYMGVFSCQETGGSASDGVTPAGKSLESYVFGTNGATGGLKDAVWASAICGVAAADITYLGKAMGGEIAAGAVRYNNPVYDGYRGPAKHTNGSYAWRVLRSMQLLAGINNPSAKYRGGIDRPGGLMMDAWGGGGGGWLGSAPAGFSGGGAGGGNGILPAFAAAHPEVSTGGDGAQPLWAWDYQLGLPKFKLAKARVDQNLIPGIRTSLGLHPYVVGAARTTEIVPYDAWDTALGAGNYKVETLLLFKNSPGLSRANIDLDVEAFTATDGGGNYRLPHIWSIDIHMGSSSRYSDIVLPDTTFYERYDLKDSWENFGLMRHIQMRQPVVSNLYSAKQVKQIVFELSRYIEAPTGGGTEAPWSGALIGAYKFTGNSYDGTVDPGNGTGKPGDVDTANAWTFAGGATAPTSLRAIEANIMNATNNASIPGATRVDKFNFMRDHSVYWTGTTTPNYFPHGSKGAAASYTGGLKTGGEARIEIYQASLAATTDPSLGNLIGTPVYVPVTQQTSGALPLHLTTYKLNVHTQSRTAACPRLMEILGNNWAVIHPTTAAAQSPAIVNGDTVKITTAEGSVTLEAKVTAKAQVGCVHVSHSIGDEYVNNGPYAHGSSKGRYQVDRTAFGGANDDDRSDAVSAAGSPGANVYSAYNATVTGYSTVSPDALGRVGASAPLWRADGVDVNGSAAHVNHALNRTADGTWTGYGTTSPVAATIGTSIGLVTDPVGGSMGWFDSKCKIEKV